MTAQRLTPAGVEQLAALLRTCNADGTAAVIQGGNTLHAMGAAPDRPAVTISTAKIDRVLTHEYRDLTCAVAGGMRLRDLRERLAEHGQFVPLDAPLPRKASAGGTLAAGWLGPRRHLYGRARDLLIGTHVVLADGSLVHAGGMVVKNVTGYDMSKLYAGSFGTLGVIVQANFKTLPLPERRRLLIAPLPERTRARAVTQIATAATTPAAALCVEGFRKSIDGEDGIDGRALILLEGSQALVDHATREMRSALGRAGVPETTIVDAGTGECFERILDACIASIGERSVTYRALGDPAGVHERAIALRDTANRHELFTDVLLDIMNGDLFLRLSERNSRAFAEKIEACDDDLRTLAPRRAIVAGDAPIRASLDPWGEPPGAIEKMRALKAQFDPRRILNPGRFVAGL